MVKACANDIARKQVYSIVTFYFTTPNAGKDETLKPKIVKANSLNEYLTPEHCYIAENYSSSDVSIARATVKPGVTTLPHHLKGVQEMYLITNGKAKVTVGSLEPTDVGVGDMVIIPPETSQKITNTGKTDLEFYCICTPRFTETCYINEATEKPP